VLNSVGHGAVMRHKNENKQHQRNGGAKKRRNVRGVAFFSHC
jgi:hypothetical protein